MQYLHGPEVRRDFIEFINVGEVTKSTKYNKESTFQEPVLTGQNNGSVVFEMVKRHDLDLKNYVGIFADGCSIMISVVKGAISEIKKECPNAARCLCYNHALNFSISKLSTVQSVRKAAGTMNEIATFFKALSKRNTIIFKM